jgi:uncharacterized protein YggE
MRVLDRKLLISFVTLLALPLVLAHSADAQRSTEKPRISSDERYVLAPGYGEVIVKPLQIELVTVVETIADTDVQAQLGSEAALGRLIVELKTSGILHDLRYSHIMPIERREVPIAKQGTVAKYVVRRSIDIDLHEPDKLKQLADFVIQAGGKDLEARNYVLGNVKLQRRIAYDKAVSEALAGALQTVREKQFSMINPRVISERGGRSVVNQSRVSDRLRVAKSDSSVVLDGSTDSILKAAELGKESPSSLVALYSEVWLGADLIKP